MNYVILEIAAFCMLLWGLACAGYGLLVLTHAQSAIHEIEAGVALTIATISIGFAFLIGSRLEMNSRDHPSRKLLWFVLTGLLVTAVVVSVLWRPLGKGVEPLTQSDKGVGSLTQPDKGVPKMPDDDFYFAIGYAEAKLYACQNERKDEDCCESRPKSERNQKKGVSVPLCFIPLVSADIGNSQNTA